jgi:hypothetical protein
MAAFPLGFLRFGASWGVYGRFMGAVMGANFGHLSFSFNELGAMGAMGAINSHI